MPCRLPILPVHAIPERQSVLTLRVQTARILRPMVAGRSGSSCAESEHPAAAGTVGVRRSGRLSGPSTLYTSWPTGMGRGNHARQRAGLRVGPSPPIGRRSTASFQHRLPDRPGRRICSCAPLLGASVGRSKSRPGCAALRDCSHRRRLRSPAILTGFPAIITRRGFWNPVTHVIGTQAPRRQPANRREMPCRGSRFRWRLAERRDLARLP